MVGRFAPTTSGRAHPGTLVSGLLAWLDSRSRGGRFVLRLEDIDPSSARPEFGTGLLDDLTWFGLEWDETVWQSSKQTAHQDLLDRLAATGRLYACRCSRSKIAKFGHVSAGGGFRYPGTCRARRLTNWRSSTDNIRIDLGDQIIACRDQGGRDLSQTISQAMGDPLLRRADGSWTYMLAVVADDHAAGATDIVRGSDLAATTATQVALYRLADWSPPDYRHHFLLLEQHGQKLAKLHQSITVDQLRNHYTRAGLAGFLAMVCGLQTKAEPLALPDLLANFSWKQIRQSDVCIVWNGTSLDVA